MSEVSSAEVVRALKAAKTKIVTVGWTQRAYRDDDGRRCVIGAIALPELRGPVWASRMASVMDALVTTVGVDSPRGLEAWNDAPDRTLEDVLQAFDAAIELARGP